MTEKTIKMALKKWINEWADLDKHVEGVKDGKLTEFGDGYKAALRDVYDYLVQVD